MEKEKGIVKNIDWMEVGKREASGELLEEFLKHELETMDKAYREFGDFLRYFELLKEIWRKKMDPFKLIN